MAGGPDRSDRRLLYEGIYCREGGWREGLHYNNPNVNQWLFSFFFLTDTHCE